MNMGFGSWFKENVWNPIKETGQQVAEAAKEIYHDVKEVCVEVKNAVVNKVKKTLKEWNTPPPPKFPPERPNPPIPSEPGVIVDPPYPTTIKTNPDTVRKAEVNRRARMFGVYQSQVKEDAEYFENLVRKSYTQAYSEILLSLEKVMDVRVIRNFIDKKENCFVNVMRDEVNAEVSLTNRKLRQLLDSSDTEVIQDYVNQKYYMAKNHLIELLRSTIIETNNFININSQKFLNDEISILQSLYVNKKNLSQKGEVGERELEKVTAEYATLLVVKELAEKEID